MENKIKKITIFLSIMMAVSSIGLSKSNRNTSKRSVNSRECRDKTGKAIKCITTLKSSTRNNKSKTEQKNEGRRNNFKSNTTISIKESERATSSR